MQTKEKCLICREEITEDEINYEDYYRICRGENRICDYYICFDCIRDIRDKNALNETN